MKYRILITSWLVLGMLCLAKAQTPAVPTKNLKLTQITGNSVKLELEAGDGERRLVIARKSQPTDASPESGKTYSARAAFGTGSILNEHNYVISNGSASSVTITELEPDTEYHLASFEYNNTSSPNYLTTSTTTHFRTLPGPTLPVEQMIVTETEGNRFKLVFSGGNGSKHLIIMRAGEAPMAKPENGKTYAANQEFKKGAQIAPGEFVIYNAGSNSVTVTGLDPASTYYVRIYEFDVDQNGRTFYLTSSSLTGYGSTAYKPMVNSRINLPELTGSSVTMKFSDGGGKYRMVLMRQGSPADGMPSDLKAYSGGNRAFGTGAQLGTGNYIITGAMNGDETTVTNLKAGLSYYASVIEFNGYNYPLYFLPGASIRIDIPVEPDRPATQLTVTQIEGSSFRAGWNKGAGARRLVIARKDEPVSARPADGITYSANALFGQGTELSEGEFVVYDGTEGGFYLKGLESRSVYHLAVFEYNLPNDKPDYLTSTFLKGPAATIPIATTQTSNLTVKEIDSLSVTLGFKAGNGERRILVMREEGTPNIEPEDFKQIDANWHYGVAPIGPGNYAVYASGTGTLCTVTNLRPGTRYHVSAYEYNGYEHPAYLRPAATFSFYTPGMQLEPGTDPAVTQIEGNSLRFAWKNGTGARRIVVARKSRAVTFKPVNGNSYPANPNFGSGVDMGDGQFVVYNGADRHVNLNGLTHSSAYTLAVYEYSGTGADSRYYTEKSLNLTAQTAFPPNQSSTDMITRNTSNSIHFAWTKGDGQKRIVVIREGHAVEGVPVQLHSYQAHAEFGRGVQIQEGEFVVFCDTGSEVTVTGLKPDHEYFYRIFEQNGDSAPVYALSGSLSGSVKTRGPLPVTWAYFNARISAEGVRLNWATAQESNAWCFAIERSVDPVKGFQTLDTIKASGSTKELRTYHYTDYLPVHTTSYYRLKQIDLDGRYTYSRIVSVQVDEHANVVYPNPVTDQFYITSKIGTGQMQITIYNNAGKALLTVASQNGQPTDISKLPPGTYQVVVRNGTAQFSQRIIKQ